MPSTVALNRGPATTFDTSASSVRTLYGGDCGSSESTAGRRAFVTPLVSAARAITVTLLNHCSTSEFCQIGRYASGLGAAPNSAGRTSATTPTTRLLPEREYST